MLIALISHKKKDIMKVFDIDDRYSYYHQIFKITDDIEINFLKTLLKQILGDNDFTDLDKAITIHNFITKRAWFKSQHKYTNVIEVWENRDHINCQSLSLLVCAVMVTAGLNAVIVQDNCGSHWWVAIQIQGKTYFSDAFHRPFNQVWKDIHKIGYFIVAVVLVR